MIIVLCCPDDKSRAMRLTEALLNFGQEVRLSVAGVCEADAWQAFRQEVLDAQAVVVCWSAASTTDDAARFRALAAQAAAAQSAIIVRFDTAAVPESLAGLTSYPLKPWQLGPNNWFVRFWVGDRFLKDVVIAAQQKAANMDPPPPTASVKFYRDCVVAALVAVFGPFVALGGVKQSWDFLVAQLPTPQEDAAWAAIESGTPQACSQIQAFVEAYPSSRRLAQAQAALASPLRQPQWTPRALRLDVPDALDPPAAPSETAARSVALAALELRAKDVCRGAADAAGARTNTLVIHPPELSCASRPSGWQCQIAAQVTCTQDEPLEARVCQVRP
jgi:hypothetical protein